MSPNTWEKIMRKSISIVCLVLVLLFTVSAIAADRVVVVPLGKKPTGDAVAADVKEGRTFSNEDDIGIPGTMPDYSGVGKKVYAPGDSVVNVHTGYHEGSTVATDANLQPGNIIDGVSIFGVTGSGQCVTESTADAIRQLCYNDCLAIFPGFGAEWAGCCNGCSAFHVNLLATYNCN